MLLFNIMKQACRRDPHRVGRDQMDTCRETLPLSQYMSSSCIHLYNCTLNVVGVLPTRLSKRAQDQFCYGWVFNFAPLTSKQTSQLHMQHFSEITRWEEPCESFLSSSLIGFDLYCNIWLGLSVLVFSSYE